jgi:hypothetical protein
VKEMEGNIISLDLDFLSRCVEYYARNHPEYRGKCKEQLGVLEEFKTMARLLGGFKIEAPRGG